MSHHEAIIVGGGFSGIGAAIRLQAIGIDDHVVLEKAAALGGTWRDNTYPGCACDVPSTLYSYSFARNPRWDRVFAEQPQIERYLTAVAERYEVPQRTRFRTEVTGARWDEAAQVWSLETTRGDYTAETLIAAAGPLHEPSIPEVPGLAGFRGETFHSARWNHDLDLRGRRVAVVGTGSSAIQFIPRIAPEVGHLTLLQRTPAWVLPKPDGPVPELVKTLFRYVPGAQTLLREGLYNSLELLGAAQRSPRIMEQIQLIGRLHLRLAVRDPELRRQLTPDFTLGCKRLLLSNRYYPALQRDNVTVVPHGLTAFTPDGVIDATGAEHPVDTVIFATGFHATDPPIAGLVRGRDGRSLAEAWAGSPSAYNGTVVANFPNAFIMLGPNLGNGHTSAFVVIEAQLDLLARAMLVRRRRGVRTLEVRPEVQAAYDAKVQRALAGTVWNAGGCSSWYLDRNGRNASIYPWSTFDLRRRLRRFRLRDYRTVAA